MSVSLKSLYTVAQKLVIGALSGRETGGPLGPAADTSALKESNCKRINVWMVSFVLVLKPHA